MLWAKIKTAKMTVLMLVGEEGLEPSRSLDQRILSPPRIPIPPLAQMAVLIHSTDFRLKTQGVNYLMRTKLVSGSFGVKDKVSG